MTKPKPRKPTRKAETVLRALGYAFTKIEGWTKVGRPTEVLEVVGDGRRALSELRQTLKQTKAR